jgi:hypothetical protein
MMRSNSGRDKSRNNRHDPAMRDWSSGRGKQGSGRARLKASVIGTAAKTRPAPSADPVISRNPV